MNISKDEFLAEYYQIALNYADETITKFVKKHGVLNEHIDVEGVKIVGVMNAMDRIYKNFNPERLDNNGNPVNLKSFMFKVVSNCVKTQLTRAGKEVIGAVDAEGGRPIGQSFHYGYTKINQDRFMEKVEQCIKSLDPKEQTIISCWRASKSTYVQESLAEFGWEDTTANRNRIYLKLNRAFDKIKKALGGNVPDFHDVYVSIGSCKESDDRALS